MAKIIVKDLPKAAKISQEEIRRIKGGAAYIKFYEGLGEILHKVYGEYADIHHKGWSDISIIRGKIFSK